jgi:hypothetical protein
MPRQKARPSTNPLHTRDPLDYDVALGGQTGWRQSKRGTAANWEMLLGVER